MAWLYEQKTGWLSHNGARLVQCYSGNGSGKNNPDAEAIRDVGPLPCGNYTIQPPVDTESHGPYVLWLVPDAATFAYMQKIGRAPIDPSVPDFAIHGERKEPPPGEASKGCIIEPHSDRVIVWTSGDDQLQVIREMPPTWPNE